MSTRDFVAYEYRDVTAAESMEAVYGEAYQNFGWRLEQASSPIVGQHLVTLKFKRDRKIRNKAELTRLQRQFDACAGEIVRLEKSKTQGACVAAFSIGLVGTALLAGATFSYLGGLLPLMLLLAVPGFAGWILPYFCYRMLSNKREAAVTPLIEQKYDEAYEVCEKAFRLLGGEIPEGESGTESKSA